jgi:hypothetical protein
VDWFNNRQLLEPIGNIPPAEAEERLRHAGKISNGGVTETKWPPTNAGRVWMPPILQGVLPTSSAAWPLSVVCQALGRGLCHVAGMQFQEQGPHRFRELCA